jgi:DNA invertase Pin-like site-specific DNA recombinase
MTLDWTTLGKPTATRRRRPGLAKLREAVKDVFVPYYRVSTREQADEGAGLAAQATQVNRWGAAFGKTLLEPCEDPGYSGKDLDRPGMQQALALVRAGQAGGIVVAKMDRLTRSLFDFASLMELAQREKFNIVALDLNLDLSTPTGEAMAAMLAVFAQWERRVIGQRTRDGLMEKRAQGVRLGRPPTADDELLATVLELFAQTPSYQAVADQLTRQQVPTARGGVRWYRKVVRDLVLTAQGRVGFSG